MGGLGQQALHDAAGGNAWALLALVVGVVVLVLDRIGTWVWKLRTGAKTQETQIISGQDKIVTMVEIQRNMQAMAMILEKHLDRLEMLDRNVEKTMDSVQRVEDLVKGMA